MTGRLLNRPPGPIQTRQTPLNRRLPRTPRNLTLHIQPRPRARRPSPLTHREHPRRRDTSAGRSSALTPEACQVPTVLQNQERALDHRRGTRCHHHRSRRWRGRRVQEQPE